MIYRYYRKNGQMFQVWERNTSFHEKAIDNSWTWDQLRSELEDGVVLIPVVI